jgi:crotonobetainyl-CoA:carnitine CoA-transferase CaiB-like acyl-CoA transferase
MAPPLAGFRVLDLSGCLPGCMARCSLTRITVNLKSADGPEIIQRLACVSDVLVENFKVGELAQLGLGYERLRELNPELVYCSITRYGQTGPDMDMISSSKGVAG